MPDLLIQACMSSALLRALLVLACLGSTPAISVATEPDGQKAERAYSDGQARMRRGDLTGAQADFEQAVAVDPDNTIYLNGLGLVYLRTHQGQRAVETYSRSCRLTEAAHGPLSTRVWACQLLWGHALMLLPDADGAAEKFRRSYSIAFAQQPPSLPDAVMAMYFLSRALETAGRIKEAVPLYEELQSVTPADSKYRSKVERALRSVRDGKMPEQDF